MYCTSPYMDVLGAGSFLLHHFSMLVNSILLNFGLSEEMYNPASVLLLVLIILAGAVLGYWLVRKFVISEDGSVDVGIAQFVKWAMRIIGFTFILQSTLDIPLALTAQGVCLVIFFSFTYLKWHSLEDLSYPGRSPWGLGGGRTTVKRTRAEFLSRSGMKDPRKTLWNSPRNSSKWTGSPVEGRDRISIQSSTGLQTERSFRRKNGKISQRNQTRQALAEWASSPEFTDWIIKNADRVKVVPDDSLDETVGSGSDSTDEIDVQSSNRLGFYRWQRRK